MDLGGSHRPVVWQESQLAVVGICVMGLPDACNVLWHRAHWPNMSLVCFITAPVKLFWLWQSRHCWLGEIDGICDGDLKVEALIPPWI
jgi:hypothetical protein